MSSGAFRSTAVSPLVGPYSSISRGSAPRMNSALLCERERAR